eukprot:GHVP01054610.1.p1 GENE.GHVP01054610.1~~GHVP01054610.1.p1  ORF type:complete len:127 (+),score=4.52 GHVP01054610.1:275-655(+)
MKNICIFLERRNSMLAEFRLSMCSCIYHSAKLIPYSPFNVHYIVYAHLATKHDIFEKTKTYSTVGQLHVIDRWISRFTTGNIIGFIFQYYNFMETGLKYEDTHHKKNSSTAKAPKLIKFIPPCLRN